MGNSSYSHDDYVQRTAFRAANNIPTFAYSAKTAAAPLHDRKTHDTLNPVVFGKAGKLVRESRDSTEHPNSVAIAVPFDVTGSMGGVPRIVQSKLSTLMSLLLKKNYCEDPQILVGAIGDSYCDRGLFRLGSLNLE